MSLLVNAYWLKPGGGMEFSPPVIEFWREPWFKALTREQKIQRLLETNPDYVKERAGTETYREEVWGSEAACSLGCTLLPTLRDKNIYATGDQIEQLEREVGILRDNIALLSERTARSMETLEHYLQNMTEAIGRARAISGGVVIW